MEKRTWNLREGLFLLGTWAALLWLINFACGLIVQNRYIAVDPIDRVSAKTSWGYFAPNQEKIILFPGLEEYKVTIDDLGFRDSGLAERMSLDFIKDKYRILALGDSFTFGLFVDDQDAYPYRLQANFKRVGKNAVVLNAGVGAAVMKDYLYYLKVKGLALRPQLVAISFCENDLEGLDKEPLYKRMKNDSGFSFAKTFKLANFMRIFRKGEMAYRYNRWLRKMKDPRLRQILKEESKDLDDILYVAAYQGGKPATDPYHETLEGAWQENFRVMDETIDLLRAEQIDFVFILYPNIVTVFDQGKGKYQDILRAYFMDNEVPYIDLLPEFQRRKSGVLELYNNPPRDFHLSGKGNQILADQFMVWLEESNLIEKIQ